MIDYKTVEKLLYNYNMYKANIKIKSDEIKNLLENDGLKAIDYSATSTSTNSISDSTGQIATKNIINIDKIEEEKNKLQKKINTLDILINGLNSTEQTVIIMKYIEGRQWWEISYRLQYNERHCRRIRTEAIEKIKLGLSGKLSVL